MILAIGRTYLQFPQLMIWESLISNFFNLEVRNLFVNHLSIQSRKNSFWLDRLPDAGLGFLTNPGQYCVFW